MSVLLLSKFWPSFLSLTQEPVAAKTKISSKIGSLSNINHKPKGGEKKIQTKRLSFVGVQVYKNCHNFVAFNLFFSQNADL